MVLCLFAGKDDNDLDWSQILLHMLLIWNIYKSIICSSLFFQPSWIKSNEGLSPPDKHPAWLDFLLILPVTVSIPFLFEKPIHQLYLYALPKKLKELRKNTTDPGSSVFCENLSLIPWEVVFKMDRKHLSSPFLHGHVPFSATFVFMDKNERGGRREGRAEAWVRKRQFDLSLVGKWKGFRSIATLPFLFHLPTWYSLFIKE